MLVFEDLRLDVLGYELLVLERAKVLGYKVLHFSYFDVLGYELLVLERAKALGYEFLYLFISF